MSTISSRYFNFNINQERVFCRYSNAQSYDYYNHLKKQRTYISGLFYEIKNIQGNWNFRDQVLPGLFSELNTIIQKLIQTIENYEEWINRKTIYPTPHFMEDREQKFDLLKYLGNLIIEKFIKIPALSEIYTHNMLNSEINKMRIRVINALDNITDYAESLLKHHTKVGLENLIIKKLMREKLPFVCEYSKIINTVFLYELQEDYKYLTNLKERLLECFRPDCGNYEYYLGMKPIWYDMPGSGMAAYYFANEPRSSENKNGILLIIDSHDHKTDFDREFSYPHGPSILELFKKAGKEKLFLNWFAKKEIREAISRELTHKVFWKHLNPEYYKPSEIPSYKSSNEILKANMKWLTEYMGVCYQRGPIVKIAKDHELKSLENLNIKEVYRQKQRNAINKLFLKPGAYEIIDILTIITNPFNFLFFLTSGGKIIE